MRKSIWLGLAVCVIGVALLSGCQRPEREVLYKVVSSKLKDKGTITYTDKNGHQVTLANAALPFSQKLLIPEGEEIRFSVKGQESQATYGAEIAVSDKNNGEVGELHRVAHSEGAGGQEISCTATVEPPK